MKRISSVKNPLLQEIHDLQSGRRTTANQHLIVLEGGKLIAEAVASGHAPRVLLLAEGAPNPVPAAVFPETIEVPFTIMKRLTGLTSPGPCLAVLAMTPPPDQRQLLERARTLIVLDRVQDPGNLGTIFRSTEAFGGDAILSLEGSCHVTNPKVIRSSMGSAFRVPSLSNLSGRQLVSALKRQGLTCLATTARGKPLAGFSFPERVALFFGTEGQGLDPLLERECDEAVGIPLRPPVESLNVATAVALCLFERTRQLPGTSRAEPGQGNPAKERV